MLAALFGKGQKELKVLYILITLTLAAILLYPLGCVLFQSVLTKEGGIGLTNYTSLLSQSSFWTALANSFTVSGISAYYIRFCSHLLIRTFRSHQSINCASPIFYLWFLGITDCRCYLYAAAGFSDSL